MLPLPYHAKREYTEAAGRLEDEWTYRQHPEDWQTYHTRYVTPDVFRNALRAEAANDEAPDGAGLARPFLRSCYWPRRS